MIRLNPVKKYFSAIIFFILWPSFCVSSEIIDEANEILRSDPSLVFNKNLESGVVNFVHVPHCGETMPGFDFSSYRGERPNPDPLWVTCADLIGEDEHNALIKLRDWADRYNRLVWEWMHESERNKNK